MTGHSVDNWSLCGRFTQTQLLICPSDAATRTQALLLYKLCCHCSVIHPVNWIEPTILILHNSYFKMEANGSDDLAIFETFNE